MRNSDELMVVDMILIWNTATPKSQ
jgi:quercetin dioxygenase-like cupin family protein